MKGYLIGGFAVSFAIMRLILRIAALPELKHLGLLEH